ncbi:MAG: LysM peptidoglycan-binding domain-containing protein [Enterocloster clostridioformis]|nr:LysM peptidoglycan-binding domain-containing protein [Enterocloster clostridioformis]
MGESLSTDTVTYKVKKGDSLWNIAKRQLGDPLKWDIIYQLNSSTVKNPDLIYEGQTLDIPKA